MSSAPLEGRPAGKRGRLLITDFLLARVADDEAIARSLPVHTERAQAVCWTQRQLVYLHAERAHGCVDYPCSTLRIMAMAHAGHHDYDPRWRPESTTLRPVPGHHV